MRLKDIKKASKYLERILKDPFSRQSRAALRRYVGEFFSLVYEKGGGGRFHDGISV